MTTQKAHSWTLSCDQDSAWTFRGKLLGNRESILTPFNSQQLTCFLAQSEMPSTFPEWTTVGVLMAGLLNIGLHTYIWILRFFSPSDSKSILCASFSHSEVRVKWLNQQTSNPWWHGWCMLAWRSTDRGIRFESAVVWLWTSRGAFLKKSCKILAVPCPSTPALTASQHWSRRVLRPRGSHSGKDGVGAGWAKLYKLPY